MGNQSSTDTFKHLKNYEQVTSIDEGSIYRQRSIDQNTKQQIYQYFLLKQHNYPNQVAFNDAYKRFKDEIIKHKSEDYQSNSLNIRQAVKQEIHHFCSNTYKIYALYEYPELNLKNQIEVRATMNKYFEEEELIAILQTCILSLQQIKASISFNTKSIFISPDGVIKVLHNDLVDQNYRHLLTQNIYYAPEKLINFSVQNVSQNSVKKEIIFSIGMTLLEACCLQELYQLYNYDQKIFDDKSLENKIYKLGSKYSTDLLQLLSNMLQINPNRRISLLEIQRVLNKYDQETIGKETIQCEERENIEKKYSELFEKSNDKQTKMQSLTSSMDEPSVHNLLSQQNSSRLSLNNPNLLNNNYRNQQIFERDYQYKMTSNHILSNNSSQSIKNVTANWQTEIPQKKNDEKLFTDPKLLEMIRRDLDQINRSKTSRMSLSQNQAINLNNFNSTGSQNYCDYLYLQGQNEYQSLSNCPQVQSLTASVAYENNSHKKYIYEQSSVKYHPQELENSIALSTNNFRSSQDSKNSPLQNNQKTVRQPLGEVDHSNHQNIQSNFGEFDYKLDMKKKKESNLVYLQQIYEDGIKYQGMSRDGLKQGKGKLIYNDGAYYEGEFKDDRINGYGVLYYCKNRPAYDGMWENEQFHGQGKLFNEEPQKLHQEFPYHNFNLLENYWIRYEGGFRNDNKHGRGRIYLTSEEYIEGEFYEDMVHGWGRFHSITGEVVSGKWQNNILVEEP